MSERRADDYVFGLDLIRFSAATMVALFHLTWHAPMPALAPYGWVGVQIFFVLSGFVITQSARGRTTRSFLLGRAGRLYPAAWWCAGLNLGAIALLPANVLGPGAEFPGVINFKTVLGALTLFSTQFPTNAYWTLPVELVFYAVVAVLLSRSAYRHLEKVALGLIAWSAPYVIVLMTQLLGLHRTLIGNQSYDLRNALLIRHGMFFGAGILLSLAVQTGFTRRRKIALAFAGVLALFEIITRADWMAPWYERPRDAHVLALQACVVFLVAVCAIPLASRYNAHFPAHLQQRARTLGLMTYPIYLLHERVGGSAVLILNSVGVPYPVALFAGMFLVALVSYAVVRSPEPWLRARLFAPAAAARAS